MKFLTKDSMQKPRTPKDLLEWANKMIDKMRSSSEGKKALRFNRGLAKELVDELLPLGLFGTRHFKTNPEVKIIPSIGCQNYDAKVQGDEGPIDFIEVTQAHEGRNDHLRKKVLEDKGIVSGTGKVSSSGNKRTGHKINTETRWHYAEDLKNEEWERIKAAATRKSSKHYRNNTALVIMFNGKFLLSKPEYRGEVEDLIKEELVPDLRGFALVAFVDWYEDGYFEYNP